MKWLNRIELSEKNKHFTKEDIKLSQLWITDPISEFSTKIELKDNDLNKGPVDIYLILDGIYFTVGIEKNDIGLVKFCYNNIIKRVEKLQGEKDKNIHSKV